MRLLWIATKAPWPPVDGGRLLMWETLRAFGDAGHRIDLVAPIPADLPRERRSEIEEHLGAVCSPRLVPRRAPGLLRAWLRGVARGGPATLVRHESPEVVAAARSVVSSVQVDVVVAEQLQAYPQARAAAGREVPVVVRAQNVESDLWRGAARGRGLGTRWLLRSQARRLERAEGRLLADADAVVAISREDARRLRELGGPSVDPVVVYPPFPRALPRGETPLPGEPALVVLGSAGWAPNEDSIRWVVGELWPRVRARFPEAVLHVFGAPGLRADHVVGHEAPRDSAAAFAPGCALLVPLRVASGIRMKVLEAWARGIPVIATRVAARGLPETAEEAVLCADTAEELVAAVEVLRHPAEVERLVSAGQDVLREHHAPGTVVERLAELFESVRRETDR